MIRPAHAMLVCLLVVTAYCTSANAADPKELVVAFAKQKDPRTIQAMADKVAAFLTSEVGVPVKAFIPTDYGAVVQAMVSGKADVAYTDSIPFLLARRDGDAQLLLVEQRIDPEGNARTDYDSILVVRADSPIKTMDDLIANASNLRVAFTSPTSTSGYVMAYRRFVNEKLLKVGQDPKDVFKAVAFGGSYTQALEQVADGRADFCAVSDYTMSGPRADVYLKPELRQKLRILARTPGVPTHVISVRGALSSELKAKIKAAMLKLEAQTLSDVYGASKLVEVDEDKHVAGTVEAMTYLGKPVDSFVKTYSGK